MMMSRARHLAATAVALGVALGGARAAEARLLDARAGVRLGGMAGWGSSDTTPDFFHNTAGFGGGFELGARLLIFDASVSFLQLVNSSGWAGTLTQVQLGVAFDIPIGEERKTPDGKTVTDDVIHPAIVGGFGFGTPAPVKPPLTNDEISDKGIVAVAKVGYEHFLNQFLAIGLEGDIGYHYFLGGQVVTNNNDHSSGPHFIGLGTLTFHLGY
jgi:hypothetical protein